MTLSARLAHARVTSSLAAIVMIMISAGCNRRTPVLEGEFVTAPTAGVPRPPVIPAPPADIVKIAMTPPGDRGGAAGFGTVSLDSPAPEGGLVVTLQSADESTVTVSPRQLVVPGGALSANFQFSTRAVTRDVNVVITASTAARVVSDYVSVWTPTTQFFSYTADPVGFISPAPTVRWSSDAGTRFDATCFGSSVTTSIFAPGNSVAIVSFGAPQGQPFRPGIYNDAQDQQSNTTRNFMAVSPAGNCGVTGRFEVRELETRADGTVSSLWVAFEQGCRNQPGVLRGAFRISNAVPRPNQICRTR